MSGDKKYVFWLRLAPMSIMWSHEKAHTQSIEEPSLTFRRIFCDASGKIQGLIGATSAKSYWCAEQFRNIGYGSAKSPVILSHEIYIVDVYTSMLRTSAMCLVHLEPWCTSCRQNIFFRGPDALAELLVNGGTALAMPKFVNRKSIGRFKKPHGTLA